MAKTPPLDHRTRFAAARRERMRARLLDAALMLGASRGMEAITIDNVISEAQVARGSFYKYFATPAELVQALAVELSDELIRAMHPLVEPLADPAARVAIGIRTALLLAKAYPALGSFMVRAGWPAMERTHGFFTLVAVDIRKGIRSGRFAARHAEVALNLVAGTVVGAMHSVTQKRMPRDFPEQTALAVLRGLGLPEQEAAKLVAQPVQLPAISEGSILSRLMQSRETQ